MRIHSIITCLVVMPAFLGYPQEKPADRRAEGPPPIQIGPVAGMNVELNTVDYQVAGAERSFGVGSTFGVLADIPVNEQVGFMARMHYYTLSFSDENDAVDIPVTGRDVDVPIPTPHKLKTEGSFNYLALAVCFRFSYFCIGLNFGLPLTATITNSTTYASLPITIPGTNYQLKKDISPADGDRNTLIEATIGGDFPIMRSELGSFRLGIFGSYPFTTMLKSAGDNLPHLDHNFRLPSLMMNVAYLFSI